MLENPPTRKAADTEHLKLIAIFHYIVSGLAAFCACINIHLVIGLFMIFAPEIWPRKQSTSCIHRLVFRWHSFFLYSGWLDFRGPGADCREVHRPSQALPVLAVVACVELHLHALWNRAGGFNSRRPTVKQHLFNQASSLV